MKTIFYILTLLITANIAAPVHSQSQQTYQFKWDNLFLAAARMNEHFDYEANTDWYMQYYRPDVWQFAREDEFTLREKRDETEKLFKEKVAKFDPDRDFVLRSTLTVGDYDFEHGHFPVRGIDSGYHWLDRSYKNGRLPNEYSAYPTNIEILNRIPMSKVEAKNFINRRKDRYGKVDRRVYVKFTLKLKDMRDRSSFNAEIQQGRFYFDRSYTIVLGKEFKLKVDTKPSPDDDHEKGS